MANQSKDKQLKFLFNAYTPQVRAGSRSNNRFSFQEAWSLDRLIDQHIQLTDYLAVFDFLEDFIIFEDPNGLSPATFYQIKTKDAVPWKLTDLTKKQKSQKCFIDKLADSATKFKKLQLKLYLVLNGSIEITLNSEASYVEFGFHEIETKDEAKIKKKTTIGSSDKKYKSFAALASVVITTLPLDEIQRENQIKGKLSNLLTSLFPSQSYQIIPIYDCLKVEISRRSKFEQKVKNIRSLKDNKGITKDQFAQFLSIGVTKTQQNEWQAINQRLTSESVPLKTIKDLRDGFNELSVLRTGGSPSLEKIAQLVGTQIEAEESRQSRLIDLIEAVYNNVKTTDYLDGYKEIVIKALVAYEYQKKG